ncbi:MAG: carbohydrate ABC transporter permease [Chloroflexi bacterium]|nr:carbohydrate ABC transporter permease [Chloroflexota bacterium]
MATTQTREQTRGVATTAPPRPPRSREEIETVIARVLKWFFIIFFVITTAFPFYWMLTLSVRDMGDVLLNPTRLFPTLDQLANFWEPYQAVLVDFNFSLYIGNSLALSVVVVLLTLLLAIPGAYAVTRLDFRLKAAMSWGILLVYMFPAIVIGIPLFVVFSQLGARGSFPTMVIVYMSGTLPVALYMLRSYFQTIPAELEEAALIDGMTRINTIWRIVLPLSIPAVASVALYTFMIAWNEFLFAILFLTDSPLSWTLPLGLRQLDSQEVPRTMLMAGSVIITVPVIVLFFFFERFLTRGLTAGAVKG